MHYDYTVKVHDIMMTNVGPLGSEDLSVEIIRQLVSQSKQVVKDVAKGKLVDGLSTKLFFIDRSFITQRQHKRHETSTDRIIYRLVNPMLAVI
jgi:hypothetical protein